MHTSTSPQYAIIASCDVSAAMMEPPGGTALVEESIIEALDFRRAMRKVDDEWGKDWWFKVWGPERLAPEGHRHARGLDPARRTRSGTASAISRRASTCSTRSRRRSSRRASTCPGKFAKTGIPASIVTRYLAEHGVIVEKTGLYSFFIMFTIGITKGRWNTLVTALQQFKDDYDKNQPLWRILPEFCAKHPRYERVGLRDLCQQIHEHVQGQRRRARDDRDVPVGHAAGDEAVGRVRVHGAPRDRPRRDRRARRPRDRRAADAVPAGHPAADSGRALQPDDRRVPEVRAQLQRAVPRLRHRHPRPRRGRRRRGKRRYFMDCVRQR